MAAGLFYGFPATGWCKKKKARRKAELKGGSDR
jgi:hypothetical protein